MAGQVKVNPAATTVPMNVVGKDLQFFTIDYIEAINGSAGPLGNSNTEQTFIVEGEDPVVVATLQADIRALGTHDSVNVSSATVTAKTLVIAL